MSAAWCWFSCLRHSSFGCGQESRPEFRLLLFPSILSAADQARRRPAVTRVGGGPGARSYDHDAVPGPRARPDRQAGGRGALAGEGAEVGLGPGPGRGGGQAGGGFQRRRRNYRSSIRNFNVPVRQSGALES